KVGPFSMEYRMMGKDGRIVWVRDEAVVVERDRKGLWNVWQGVLMDITERKQAEERFLEAETRYRSLVETIPAVTYVDLVDELSTTVYVSPQIETMLGYTPKHWREDTTLDRKSTRLNSSHVSISYAVFCLKKKHNKGVSTTNDQVAQQLWSERTGSTLSAFCIPT